MTFSLNEIEAMARRAARGAGCDWGIAEEAGRAARWPAERGLPGPELLADLLTRIDGTGYAALAPASTDGHWQAPGGWLCPLIAGAALADRAGQAAAGVELGPTAFPLLLVPYAAMAARAEGVPIRLAWTGVQVTVFPAGGLSVAGEPGAVAARFAEAVRCGQAESAAPAQGGPHRACPVEAEAWDRLAAFAKRTYAPATEASRRLGAGAGLTDND